ncbi:MAG: DUF4124 domain-containing protein [Candidatus Tectomicrobia bacterium]|uniref:DUF4124 domain-containing protein n=1 Tax=Tectimicrobiota bacterium TaxID=2528274 RepID=A0A932M111_UNCTE|nr:DUF4124 domain-containing protein [Candidatus Tectomicrobia bacterium]
MSKTWPGVIVFTVVLLGALAVLPLPAGGQQTLYKWVDDKGTVHFSDNYYAIPPQYRSQVEQRPLGAPEGSAPAKGAEGTKPSEAGPAGKEAPGAKEAPEKEATTYGGQTEEQWKKAFSDLSKKVQQLQSEVTQKKTYLQAFERGRRMGSSYSKVEIEQYDQYKKEIAGEEARLKELQSQQEELNRKATYLGVPRRIRGQ